MSRRHTESLFEPSQIFHSLLVLTDLRGVCQVFKYFFKKSGSQVLVSYCLCKSVVPKIRNQRQLSESLLLNFWTYSILYLKWWMNLCKNIISSHNYELHHKVQCEDRWMKIPALHNFWMPHSAAWPVCFFASFYVCNISSTGIGGDNWLLGHILLLQVQYQIHCMLGSYSMSRIPPILGKSYLWTENQRVFIYDNNYQTLMWKIPRHYLLLITVVVF